MNISRQQCLFSVKVYISAMLAYLMAVELGLANPYWAMVTCCVLSNPLSAVVRAKATYRFAGTLFAGFISLLLCALLVNEPLILVMVTGLVSSAILALSYADRTPRAYSLQLAGVTIMLVLVAYLDQPESMFTMVVTRVVEICIGILSVTFVDALIFPETTQTMLQLRVDNWISDLKAWRDDCLTGIADQTTERDRLALLADVSSLSQLVSTMKLDHAVDRQTRQAMIALQRQIMAMIPSLSALGHAIHSLSPETRGRLSPSVESWKANNEVMQPIVIPKAVYQLASPWEKLVLERVQRLLNQHLSDWASVTAFQHFLAGKPTHVCRHHAAIKAKAFPLPPDTGLMLRMFVGILLSYSLLSTFWYFTGWNQGPNMVLLGVVAISFFGGGDEPGMAIMHFGRFAFISTLTAFILGYVLLPLANSQTSFLLIMAAFMLPMGIWASKNPLAMLVLALSLSNVNFQNHYSPFTIGFFLESAIAMLVGVFVAFIAIALSRRWGAQHALQHLLKREHQDQQTLVHTFDDAAIETYATRSLDRMALQVSRLGAALGKESLILLNHLKANITMAKLRQLSDFHPMSSTLQPLLEVLSLQDYHPEHSAEEHLRLLDHILERANNEHQTDVVQLLTGLRMALYPTAPDWTPLYA
ncbi:FUSC family protein (plasmid) [Pseudoalteromonas xiamenensis]|uniref:FUSC family protein n=1 Tax=Pseudoalteromonas xiamenensis TaxID=882626 RepID=UPI0027E4C3F8|nr:FUSC family protein [Pseudoalteromonas xiamenensis]WMN61664.1 FUSC family protein [Pseudoalteromonas xiamenensis]